MKKSKLLLAAALLTGALIAAPSPAQAIDAMDFEWGPVPITVHVDGEYLPMDVDPVIVNGRTMVPLRAAGEAVGATVNWNQASQTASANVNGKNVTFTIGINTYYVNGTAYTSDVAPMNKSGRTLLPLRAFGDACGVTVEWDNNLRDVKIDTPAENAVPLVPAGVPNDVATMIQKYYVQNKPGTIVGNWQGKTNVDTWGSNLETEKKYIFITRYNDTYQAFCVGTEQTNFYNGVGIFIQKLNVITDRNTTYLSPYTDFNTSLIYYRIPGNGITEMVLGGPEQYKLSGETLTCTSKSMGIVGWIDQNEPYTRF